MTAAKLKPRELSGKMARQYDHLQQLLVDLDYKSEAEMLDPIVSQELETLNALPKEVSEKDLHKQIQKVKSSLFAKVEKKLKIVPKHYYRDLWLPLGMSVFGIPLGVAVAMIMDNMALFAVGFPVGMAIGMAYGFMLDNKAKEEGRQLDFGLNPE